MRLKTYVDGGYGFKGIPTVGGTLSRPVKILFAPTTPMDAVTKGYVDTAAAFINGSTVVGTFSAARLPAWTGSDVSSAGGGVFSLSSTGVAAGTYSKVTVDVKGRVTAGGSLIASDIPALSWSKIINTPTTLAGYGIVDVLTLAGGTMTGTLTLSQNPTLNTHIANKAYTDATVSGGGVGPYSVGDIVHKTTTTAPSGFLRCNGGDLSKVTYAGLFAVVGYMFTTPTSPLGSGQPWKQQYDINPTQSADITGWTTGTTLPVTLAYAQAVVTKNRVYLLGGFTGVTTNAAVYTAVINSDGTLGTWGTSTNLPGPLYGCHVFVTKNRVYLVGGQTNSGLVATVYTAPINTDGTFGTWATGTSLPGTVYYSQPLVTKDRVYLLGGYINGAASSTVYTAPINTDGTIGSWVTGTSLPGTLYLGQMAVTKNRVYLLGGLINGAVSSTVYTAPINTDGTLGTWTTGTSLPGIIYQAQVLVTRSKVYMIGGYINGVAAATGYSAPINADGTIGTWTTGTTLPASVYVSQVVAVKNRIHLIGGASAGYYSNVVYTAAITGSLSDYSPYYDGGATYIDTGYFSLPDLSSKDKPGAYSYIKT